MPKQINAIYREVGLKIQMNRKRMNFTQKELAKRLGISSVYMGYLEQGREKSSTKLLVKIESKLKLRRYVLNY